MKYNRGFSQVTVGGENHRWWQGVEEKELVTTTWVQREKSASVVKAVVVLPPVAPDTAGEELKN